MSGKRSFLAFAALAAVLFCSAWALPARAQHAFLWTTPQGVVDIGARPPAGALDVRQADAALIIQDVVPPGDQGGGLYRAAGTAPQPGGGSAKKSLGASEKKAIQDRFAKRK